MFLWQSVRLRLSFPFHLVSTFFLRTLLFPFIFPSPSCESRARQTVHDTNGRARIYIFRVPQLREFSNYVNMACERWCFNRGCDGAIRGWPCVLLLLAFYVFQPSIAANEFSESFLESTCCTLDAFPNAARHGLRDASLFFSSFLSLSLLASLRKKTVTNAWQRDAVPTDQKKMVW